MTFSQNDAKLCEGWKNETFLQNDAEAMWSMAKCDFLTE